MPTALVVGLISILSISTTVTLILVSTLYRDWKTGVDIALVDILMLCAAPILGWLFALVIAMNLIDDVLAGKPVVIIKGKGK